MHQVRISHYFKHTFLWKGNMSTEKIAYVSLVCRGKYNHHKLAISWSHPCERNENRNCLSITALLRSIWEIPRSSKSLRNKVVSCCHKQLSQANSGIIKLPYKRLKLFPSIFTLTLPHESTEYADEKGSVIN